MTRVRATDPRPCPKCGKIYRSAHTLRTHLEDKHTVCSGYRCVLCGTVAKSRNSLHSHMSRQHRGISTKDLPVQPMPSNFDPELASNLLLKAGVKISPAELRARASPTDAVTTGSSGQRRSDLQSANSSVCDGDDPEDLTINSSQNHGNNNQLRYGPGDVQQLQNKYPTAMDLMDNYARTGGGASGGALSPFLPSFAKDPGDKMSPYNNKAFLDSYLKALVETNSPLFYASKLAGDMIKHDIAADDAEYSSASDEEEDDDSVNNSPLALQAGKN